MLYCKVFGYSVSKNCENLSLSYSSHHEIEENEHEFLVVKNNSIQCQLHHSTPNFVEDINTSKKLIELLEILNPVRACSSLMFRREELEELYN